MRALVTGGTGFVGSHVVRALVEAGVRVVIFDLERSLALHPAPAGVTTFPIDATEEATVEHAFAGLRAVWGGIDGLINLVGFAAERVALAELPASEWDRVVDGNLRAAYLLCRGAVPLIRAAGGGTIVNVASGLAVRVLPGFAPYSASKAGMIALTKALAVENAPAIRANAVAPAAVETEFLTGGTGRERTAAHLDVAPYVKMIPLQRLAVPADIVGPVLFLAGPASGYMTGQTLYVNGGALTP